MQDASPLIDIEILGDTSGGPTLLHDPRASMPQNEARQRVPDEMNDVAYETTKNVAT